MFSSCQLKHNNDIPYAEISVSIFPALGMHTSDYDLNLFTTLQYPVLFHKTHYKCTLCPHFAPQVEHAASKRWKKNVVGKNPGLDNKCHHDEQV